MVGSAVEAAVGVERLEQTLAPSKPLFGWLRGALERGAVLASVCTGSLVLADRFKEATGETPIGYLQHLRIEAAKHLLESSREQTARIIWSVGYEDASSFRRLFKRTVGCTMEQYRKRFSYVSPHAA